MSGKQNKPLILERIALGYCKIIGIVFRWPGFHHLPGVGTVPIPPGGDDRIRLWATPRHRTHLPANHSDNHSAPLPPMGGTPGRRPPHQLANTRSDQRYRLNQGAGHCVLPAWPPQHLRPGPQYSFSFFCRRPGLSPGNRPVGCRHVPNRLFRLSRLPG